MTVPYVSRNVVVVVRRRGRWQRPSVNTKFQGGALVLLPYPPRPRPFEARTARRLHQCPPHASTRHDRTSVGLREVRPNNSLPPSCSYPWLTLLSPVPAHRRATMRLRPKLCSRSDPSSRPPSPAPGNLSLPPSLTETRSRTQRARRRNYYMESRQWIVRTCSCIAGPPRALIS